MLSRLSDYSKELTFWKDTLKKILYKTETRSSSSEVIFDTVTETLKTYGTRKNYKDVDFDTLTVLQGILKESSKNI